jgi:ribosomal protein S12 methylthiotransferase accessory factor
MDISSLVQEVGGLFSEPKPIHLCADEPQLSVYTTGAGDVTRVWEHLGLTKKATSTVATSVESSGVGLRQNDAIVPTLAEALERYCTSIFSTDQFVVATAGELGASALDLATLPVCSERELAHPRCPLMAPDKDAPMRWVKAISLLDGKDVYVPAITVYLHTGYAYRSERIWVPITTGCAAHVSYEQALLSAIMEVVERDALSVLWLQRLPLPKIEVDCVPDALEPYWTCYQRSSLQVEYFFFDATTELGIPIVYSIQRNRTSAHAHTLVSCSAASSATQAVVKVMRDMVASRIPFRYVKRIPADFDNFTQLFHGASYMARAENASAFDFLLRSPNRRLFSEMLRQTAADEKVSLAELLQRCRRRKWDVFAVDLTTDEAMRVGFRVVRVLIPALQPFAFMYRARYLGHPRVYEAPLAMGYPARGESGLNSSPQPFA